MSEGFRKKPTAEQLDRLAEAIMDESRPQRGPQGTMLGFKRLRPGAVLPTRATAKSACLDVYAAVDADIDEFPVAVPTGWHLVIPDGYRVDVKPRSGLALKHGIMVLNSPGTIDQDYPGELMVILAKLRHQGVLPLPYEVKAGDRIAQISLERVVEFDIVETDAAIVVGDRSGGLGSTGR